MPQVSKQHVDHGDYELFAEAAADPIGSQAFGLWLYMLGDAIIYAALFAAYSVLHTNFADGPPASEVVHPLHAFGESILIFASAGALGQASVALANDKAALLERWLGLAFALGACFIALEVYDFYGAAAQGTVPQLSGYLSIYFTLVGLHGLHIAVGLVWMALMGVQIRLKGLTENVIARFVNLKIFWFLQAVIWVSVYIFVYLFPLIGAPA